jgi:hypothetical protein
MTPLELQIGKMKAKTAFSSLPSIVERIGGNLRAPGVFLATNLGYRKHARAEIKKLKQFESQMQPGSDMGMDLDVFIKSPQKV